MSLADLLHGDFKQSQYGRIILPFTLLRRLECVLVGSKEAVLAEFEKVQKMNLPEEEQEKLLLRATNRLSFFNTSKMDLSKLGESGIKANLDTYLQGFYKDAREIFEHFKFAEFIGQLNDANLLYKIVQKVRTTNLSPKAISKHDMGKVQLINGVNLCGKMRKSLGSKRNVMDDEDIVTITRSFGEFEVIDARELDKPTEQKSNRGRQPANPKTETAKTFTSKIFATHEFGYCRITIERPLCESFQFSDERIATLRFAPKPLNTVMQCAYAEYGEHWCDDEGCEEYGQIAEHEEGIRNRVKSHFCGLKERQIEDLLHSKIWLT